MKTLLVNNYLLKPSRINRLQKVISLITGEQPKVVHISNIEGFDETKYKAIVLSGGEAPLNLPEVAETYSKVSSWIKNIRKPTLGICFGHQLLGFTFGGRVARLSRKLEGFYEVEILNHDTIFQGLPDKITVYKSNTRVVAKVMSGFELLARSVEYEVEAIKYIDHQIFGVQFHPENYSKDYFYGKRILENFFNVL